jgi:hypothetical protein
MFKGHDTSASMMGWFLYLMAANPECQVNYLLYYIIYLQSKIKYLFGIYGEFHMIPCTTIALYNRKKRTTNYKMSLGSRKGNALKRIFPI